MAFIPGYEYDIFISYAHVDNAAFPGQAEGWIEQFYKNLNLMLAKRFGRMDTVKIWWDNKKLDGSVLFDESIKEGIRKSAILVCLNSPGYAVSDYCKQELNLFYKKVQSDKTGLSIAARSRIVNVLLNNIPFSEWPSELSGTTGFPFHDAKEDDDYGDPLDTGTTDFRTNLQNLRDAIYKLLTDFHDELSGASLNPEEQKEEDEDHFTIFMGEVSDSLRTVRKRTITELEKKGFNVVTGIPPPDEAAAHEQKVKKELEKAHLSIHLLDQYPGKEVLDTPEIWYPQKQTELALEFAKSKMIWVPSETDIVSVEEEGYKNFMQSLESGKASNKEYEYIKGSKSELPQLIIDFAEQLKLQQLPKQAEKGKTSVLLDTHYNDQIYALDLSKVLIENHIQPFINPQEDDPRTNINVLSERISQVTKLIFLYGNVSKEWVLERMSAALQLIITKNYPIQDFFIYMAPPHKEANDIAIRQKFLKVNVIDSSNNPVLNQAMLTRFLHDLKTNAV